MYRDSAQSHASGCHSPFLLFCFLFKNCWQTCKDSPGIGNKRTMSPLQPFWNLSPSPKRWSNVKDGRGGGYARTGSSWWSGRTDRGCSLTEEAFQSLVPGRNRATSPATGNCSLTITTNHGTFYSFISPRLSARSERPRSCAAFVIVTALLH